MPPSTGGGRFESQTSKAARDIDVVARIAVGHWRTNRSLLRLHVRAERGPGLQMQMQLQAGGMMRSGVAYYIET
jgi:hypothetical protein